MTTTSAVGSSSQTSSTSGSSSAGLNGLTADDFLKLLITQLQNQDPTSPMDSDQLLNQVSQMRALQSNIQLSSSLDSLTLSQQLTSATALIGKNVTGTDSNNQRVTGAVESVVVSSGQTMLSIGDSQLPLSSVSNVQ